MPQPLKRSALIVFGLAILFWWSFMFAKHDPRLRGIIPFGDDPYDAVGSFGAIVGMLIALLSLVRAFRPYRKQPPTHAQRLYLVRSQEAVVLTVLVTLLADAIAMARHPSLWANAVSSRELIILLCGLAVIALAVHLLIRNSLALVADSRSTAWGRVVLSALSVTFVLAVYPEQLIQRTSTHLLTVVVGALVLFAPMRVQLVSLVPHERDEESTVATPPGTKALTSWHRWGIVVVVGIAIGGLAFLGELSEGSGAMPLTHLLFVASVFVGLGLAGLLIAYAFLGPALGLGSRG
jgi:hypothetical protein